MKRKAKKNQPDPLHGGRVHVARTRGAVSGVLLIALGVWGALIPFVGPWFNFAFSPDQTWHWTAARWWLEVLPGIVTAVGGLMLLLSSNRFTAGFGGWLAIAGGAWFVVGNDLASLFHIGSPGTPLGSSSGLRALEALAFFDGLGALILVLASLALGRLSVRSVRDVRTAQRREIEAEAERQRQEAYEQSRREQLAARTEQGRIEPSVEEQGNRDGDPRLVGPDGRYGTTGDSYGAPADPARPPQ